MLNNWTIAHLEFAQWVTIQSHVSWNVLSLWEMIFAVIFICVVRKLPTYILRKTADFNRLQILKTIFIKQKVPILNNQTTGAVRILKLGVVWHTSEQVTRCAACMLRQSVLLVGRVVRVTWVVCEKGSAGSSLASKGIPKPSHSLSCSHTINTTSRSCKNFI